MCMLTNSARHRIILDGVCTPVFTPNCTIFWQLPIPFPTHYEVRYFCWVAPTYLWGRLCSSTGRFWRRNSLLQDTRTTSGLPFIQSPSSVVKTASCNISYLAAWRFRQESKFHSQPPQYLENKVKIDEWQGQHFQLSYQVEFVTWKSHNLPLRLFPGCQTNAALLSSKVNKTKTMTRFTLNHLFTKNYFTHK